MSVSRAFTLYAATLNGTLLDQIDSQDLDTGIEQFLLNFDGGVDPVYAAVKSHNPKISLSTTAIMRALDLCSINGLAMTAGLFYFQKISQGSAPRDAGSSHVLLTAETGMILPRILQAGHDTPATMSYDILCKMNAVNAPLVATKNVSLTGSPVADEVFVAGPVFINGTELAGVQNINIDYGLNEFVMGGDGEVYTSFIGIMNRQPRITIELPDMDVLADLGIGGVAQDATDDSVVYLRKVDQDGLRVDDGTIEHISFTIDAGRISPKEGNAKPGDPASVGIEITPIFDGTNDIIVTDTSVAIT